MDKQQLIEWQNEILEPIKEFCAKKLNAEYYDLCERVVKKLGLKKSNPLVGGQVKVCSVSVIHAIGTINFLFDKSSEPFVTIDELNDFFGTNKKTTGQKSKIIRDLLKINYTDLEFVTPSAIESVPYKRKIAYDDLIASAKGLSAVLQDIMKRSKQ